MEEKELNEIKEDMKIVATITIAAILHRAIDNAFESTKKDTNYPEKKQR